MSDESLWAGLSEDAYTALAEGTGAVLSEAARRIAISRARRTMSLPGASAWDAVEHLVENLVFAREGDLLVLAEDMQTFRVEVERRIYGRWSKAFERFDVLLGLGVEVGVKLGPRREEVPPDVAAVVQELLGRAVRVGHEIGTLLRGGYTLAANARWRTAYELAVIAEVLRRGDEEDAERFLRHRVVQWFQSDSRLSGSAWVKAEDEEETESRKALLGEHDELLDRFGKSFGGRWGWAARITEEVLSVKHPQFHHLESIAEMDWLAAQVLRADQNIHGGSLGSAYNLDAEGGVSVGPDLRHVSIVLGASAQVLALALWSLTMIWQEWVEDDAWLAAVAAVADEFALLVGSDAMALDPGFRPTSS